MLLKVILKNLKWRQYWKYSMHYDKSAVVILTLLFLADVRVGAKKRLFWLLKYYKNDVSHLLDIIISDDAYNFNFNSGGQEERLVFFIRLKCIF